VCVCVCACACLYEITVGSLSPTALANSELAVLRICILNCDVGLDKFSISHARTI
jgi:hypothetical protein